MKTKILLISLLAVAIMITSCQKEDGSSNNCNNKGTLKMCNESANTVHSVIIDGTNYGNISPGNCKEESLASGKYDIEFRSTTGSGGCSQSTVTIVKCETEGRVCRN